MKLPVSELTIINRCENFDNGLMTQLDHRRVNEGKQLRNSANHFSSTGVVILRYKDSRMPIDLARLKTSFSKPRSSSRPRKNVLRSHKSSVGETQVFTKFLWKMYYGMIVPLRLRLASL